MPRAQSFQSHYRYRPRASRSATPVPAPVPAPVPHLLSNTACRLITPPAPPVRAQEYGAAIVRDPRLEPGAAAAFRSLMERYFAQPRAAKLADARPGVFYQVGATPDLVELPRPNDAFVAALAPPHLPRSAARVRARAKDPKWRFFWRVGPRPPPDATRFPQLNAPQVVPAAFRAEWAPTMDAFGGSLLAAVEASCEMLARGLGLPPRALADKLHLGPHLLAPTGADMSSPELSTAGATLAGFHYDLNFITAHTAGTLR